MSGGLGIHSEVQSIFLFVMTFNIGGFSGADWVESEDATFGIWPIWDASNKVRAVH